MTRLLAAQPQLVVYLTGEMSHTPLFQPKMQQSTSSSKKAQTIITKSEHDTGTRQT
jgi:hypothetical protein